MVIKNYSKCPHTSINSLKNNNICFDSDVFQTPKTNDLFKKYSKKHSHTSIKFVKINNECDQWTACD